MKGEVPTIAGLLDDATLRIAAALGLEKREARLEARVLAAFAWGVSPAWLIAHDNEAPDRTRSTAFAALLEQRLAGKPVAYLTGVREFYGRPFRITSDVLIPRPETELLVEQALLHLPAGRPLRVLDLGTGSGCVAVTIALERPHAIIMAVDRSSSALALAQHNANALNASVRFLQSDWFAALGGELFDLIVGNPPYVAATDPHLSRGDLRFEPISALASGGDGFHDLRRIIQNAPAHLVPGGWLWLEHGFEQGNLSQRLMREAGMLEIQTLPDAAGLPRISGGKCRKNLHPHKTGVG
ncbi:MAG: peptide chain release factor N(5)-glutamine methyltransferase [Hyphomicrobiaceae bacterium]